MRSKRLWIWPLEILKWAAVAALVCFLLFLSGKDAESTADFETVAAAVTGAADTAPMQTADNQMIRRLYGLDPVEYEGVLCMYPTSNMGVEEIFLIKLSSTEQQESVAEAVTARRDSQRTAFDGYGIEQCAMLDSSVIEVRGNYILFVCAADTQSVVNAFLGAI